MVWLPVISLLRFKSVCRSWRALIESSCFIKQHLHLHHHDPKLKDKNNNLIFLLRGKDPPITFALTSTEGFEEPNVCLQLNCLDLHGYLRNMVSYNGIICLKLFKRKGEHSICLWNPATKQSRVLPQSPLHDNLPFSIGFGFDIKSNDYKVVKLVKFSKQGKMNFEIYSLNRGSWRSLTTDFEFYYPSGNIKVPFNNGTCFFWGYLTPFGERGILCFDFRSEMFRTVSLPSAYSFPGIHHMSVVNDKIACVIKKNDEQIEMWVFDEYGTVNECWTKLYTVDDTHFHDFDDGQLGIEGVFMDGNYIFFKEEGQMCRLNVVTKETNCFTLENMPCSPEKTLVEFKESLVLV